MPQSPARSDITVVTERGQTSIPAHLRKELSLLKGRRLAWTKVGEREMRLLVLDDAPPQGAEAMRGFARRFRPQAKRTEEWLRELREGEG